jgi:predicted RND superfamily exporter protein
LGGSEEERVGDGGSPLDAMPVVARLEGFDQDSGGRLERLVFKHRGWVVAIAVALTALLGGAGLARHEVSAGFERRLPSGHPFVRNYLENARELRGLGDALYVVLETTRGDVYDPAYLEVLRRVTDELVLMPGVDRPWVRSLWLPAVRWTEVTEEGFRGGPVMPDEWDGSPAAVEALRRNVRRAGLEGSLVADDARSSLVFVPLLDADPASGRGPDHRELSARLEALRAGVEGGAGRLRLRVTGYARLVGELIDGIRQVVSWFTLAAAIAAAAIYLHTRCLRSTALVVACSALAVVWQVGLVSGLGLALDPFSVLTPFLVFALGVSHGAQKMNGILQDVGRGTHRLVAARYTFRRLFLAGLTALLNDLVGFAALLFVAVPAVRQLALTAMAGSAALVFTNLILLPVLLSFTGVSPAAAARSLRPGAGARAWGLLERLTRPRWAVAVLAVTAAAMLAVVVAGPPLEVGDQEPGAPELAPSSRYNLDAAYLADHHGLTSDPFAVLVRTGPEGCLDHGTLVEADRLAWTLGQLPSVRATSSLAGAVRQITAGTFEGNPRWLTLSRNQQVLNNAGQQALTRNPELFNVDCSVMPVVASLGDHRASTLDEVVRTAEDFARRHDGPGRRFLLAAGSAGLQAATNMELRRVWWPMTLGVFGAMVLLCLAVLRSWRAVVVAMAPVACVTVLCEAYMAWRGIGITLSTLPVIALGVGIPDYALYLLSVQLAHQRAGLPLDEAHRRSLRFTGRVVVLVAVTLAAGVVTWSWSPIRLQSAMGGPLTFMFLGNMVAALVLIPALSRLLLGDVRARPAACRAGPTLAPEGPP